MPTLSNQEYTYVRHKKPFPDHQAPRIISKDVAFAYGKGLRHTATLQNSVWDVIDKELKIKQAILIILATPIGTRFRRPDFGSLLHRLVFHPNSSTLERELILYSRDALRIWEPRIILHEVTVDQTDQEINKVSLDIWYTIKETNKIDHVIYPFNLNNPTSFTPPDTFSVGGKPVFSGPSVANYRRNNV